MASRFVASLCVVLLAHGGVGCTSPVPDESEEPAHSSPAASDPLSDPPSSESVARARALAGLRRFETERRETTDFSRPIPDLSGADPYRIAALPDGQHFVGLLRNPDQLVRLDRDLAPTGQFRAPRSPSGLAVTPDGFTYVGGEFSREVWRYPWPAHLGPGDPIPATRPDLHPVIGIRDLAFHEDRLFVVDEAQDQLVEWSLGERAGAWNTEAGPYQVRIIDGLLVVNSLLAHGLSIRAPDAPGDELFWIEHDGPIWSFDLARSGDGWLLAAAGVEDHPLDRSDGFFGHVDSYLYLYRLTVNGDTRAHRRVAEVNLSAHRIVTPKSIDLEIDDLRLRVTASGYGSTGFGTFDWEGFEGGAPEVTVRTVPPGIHEFVRHPEGGWVAANPLLDVWMHIPENVSEEVKLVSPEEGESHGFDRTVGEHLFFTTLMAPGNSSEGSHSRFTCETCHFEGHVDGRVHFTGRGDVHATTKTLRGLFNNKPHFSRALDEDLTEMVHNEFRVAGAGNGRDPWFSVSLEDHPYLPSRPGTQELSPVDLRRSLMTFLMEFEHRANPARGARESWTSREQRGAELFREHCESCHTSRLEADDPGSAVAFARWEELTLADHAPIVWGSDEYVRTGITPYVHDEGARVPSLRSLYRKRPYFTDGSAPDLRAVLDRVGFDVLRFTHDRRRARGSWQRLDGPDRAALLRFLKLL